MGIYFEAEEILMDLITEDFSSATIEKILKKLKLSSFKERFRPSKVKHLLLTQSCTNYAYNANETYMLEDADMVFSYSIDDKFNLFFIEMLCNKDEYYVSCAALVKLFNAAFTGKNLLVFKVKDSIALGASRDMDTNRGFVVTGAISLGDYYKYEKLIDSAFELSNWGWKLSEELKQFSPQESIPPYSENQRVVPDIELMRLAKKNLGYREFGDKLRGSYYFFSNEDSFEYASSVLIGIGTKGEDTSFEDLFESEVQLEKALKNNVDNGLLLEDGEYDDLSNIPENILNDPILLVKHFEEIDKTESSNIISDDTAIDSALSEEDVVKDYNDKDNYYSSVIDSSNTGDNKQQRNNKAEYDKVNHIDFIEYNNDSYLYDDNDQVPNNNWAYSDKINAFGKDADIAITSFDEAITLDNSDRSDRLKIYFKYYELDNYYSELLEANSWDYNEKDEAWYNWNYQDNYQFAINLIAEYDNDSEKVEEQDSISENIYNENNDSISDNALIIEELSDDENCILSNKEDSKVLKLFFKYELLDNRYWHLLKDNSWEYNNETQAWYRPFDESGYLFALNLIGEYNNNPLIIPNEVNNTIEYDDDYEHKIIDLLKEKGHMKAKEIAKELGISRSEVNRLLYFKLNNICDKDEEYRWYIINSENR